MRCKLCLKASQAKLNVVFVKVKRSGTAFILPFDIYFVPLQTEYNFNNNINLLNNNYYAEIFDSYSDSDKCLADICR